MLRLTTVIILISLTCLTMSRAQTATFVQPFTDTVVCHGKTVKLPFTVSAAYQPGNIFTAQLSDASGNFGTPVDIGSVSAHLSDTVTVTFPGSLLVGKGYRIRLSSSLPANFSPDNGVDIRVEYIPVPVVISNNSPVCEHDTMVVHVTNALNQNDSLVWSGGIFPIPANGPQTLTYNDAFLGLSGTYTIVHYSKASKCASPPTTTNVQVNPLPPKPMASVSPTPVCEGMPLQLNATTNPPAPGYAWTGPGGFTSNMQTPYISKIAGSGEGWYKVYSVENGCYSGKYDSVLVDVIPAPKLTITTNSPLCEGGELQAKASDTGNIAYLWEGPNGFQDNDSAIDITNAKLSASGMYYIHTERNGCESTDSIYLRVKPYPYSTTLNANSPVCEGDTLVISTVQTVQPGVVAYQFIGPGGTDLGATPPTIPNATESMEGNYLLKSDIEGCGRADSVSVVVKPTPVVTTSNEFMVTVQHPVQLLANSNIAGTGFHWQGPNGFTSNEQNPTIQAVTERNKGKYTVTGSFDGCSSDTSTEVGIWYLSDYTLFEVIPNPNNGVFQLVGRVKEPQTVDIAIYHGGSGIVLYKDKIESNGKLIDTQISLYNHLAPGEYILKARADGEAHGVKFLITH